MTDFFHSKEYLTARAKAEQDLASLSCPYCPNCNKLLWKTQCQYLDLYPPCQRIERISVYLIVIAALMISTVILMAGLNVRICVFDIATDKCIREKVVNYNEKASREW